MCGDRNWNDRRKLYDALDTWNLYSGEKITTIIEGEAKGADRLAADWGEAHGIEVLRFPADWSEQGRSAGPRRNTRMLKEGKPDLVLAFHDYLDESKGTKNMVEQAKRAGIPTMVYRRILEGNWVRQ